MGFFEKAKDEGLTYTQLVMLAQLFGLRLDVVVPQALEYVAKTKLIALMSLPSGAQHWVCMTCVADDSWVGSDSLWAEPVRMTDADVEQVVEAVHDDSSLMLLTVTDQRLQAVRGAATRGGAAARCGHHC